MVIVFRASISITADWIDSYLEASVLYTGFNEHGYKIIETEIINYLVIESYE